MTCLAVSSSPQPCPPPDLQTYQRRAPERLDHQERLAALGKMTSKVAHELNSPLDGILRYLNLATRAIAEHREDKSHEYLERCREGLHRMVHIVSELLEHVRLPRELC